MPESVTDRPTKSHEYLFLLSKSEQYAYDAEAIKDPIAPSQIGRVRADPIGGASHEERGQHSKGGIYSQAKDTRNKRTVWTVNTAPYPGAHFATFPPALVEPCILAGCPEGGTVLDPFTGSGTVGLVSMRYGRKFIGLELNPVYAEMARKRIQDDAPMFNTMIA